jgi:hypothetical protein
LFMPIPKSTDGRCFGLIFLHAPLCLQRIAQSELVREIVTRHRQPHQATICVSSLSPIVYLWHFKIQIWGFFSGPIWSNKSLKVLGFVNQQAVTEQCDFWHHSQYHRKVGDAKDSWHVR